MILKVLGPPGTGKTRCLLELFEAELKRTEPNRIAFMTFTRAARIEALERSGRREDEVPYLKTIHAMCYQQLGILRDQMLRPRDIIRFGRSIGVDLTGRTPDPWLPDEYDEADRPTPDDSLLQLNHLGRHRKIKLRDALRTADRNIAYHYARWFTQAYRDWKTREDLLDFTDLLTEYLQHGEPLDVDVMFVDEAQDLSLLQWDVVEKLGQKAVRRYIAGDDDQAIFEWAGADAGRFIEYPATEEMILGQSYRLPRKVKDLAAKVASRIRYRREKKFEPREEEGEFSNVGRLREDLFTEEKTFILYRNHFRGRSLSAELQQLFYPFTGTHSPLAVPHVKTALEAWRMAVSGVTLSGFQARALVQFSSDEWIAPQANEMLRRASKAIAPSGIFIREPRLEEWPMVLSRLPNRGYLEKCIASYGWTQTLEPKTHLMSVHQSKGQEADTVIVDLQFSRRTYEAGHENPDAEHRVWYVALTRARKKVLTLLPQGEWAYQL